MADAIPAAVPGIVKAGVVVTFFNTWVLFDETVVDRYDVFRLLRRGSMRESLRRPE